jgi:putative hydrolase of the HAD superfamily
MQIRNPATEAVFLDALGTLVELEPPWVHLRGSVPAEISDERLVRAVQVEMAYYKQHAHEGRDEQSLADLRRRCAEILSRELGVEVSAETLVAAVRVRPYGDAEDALAALGERGVRRIVVSNWDVSLGGVLERCGLSSRLDGWVSSAGAGATKPDPAIFRSALELAQCEPEAALHVGDTPEDDQAGARAAGIRALLIDRNGAGDISSLTEIVDHLDGGA